MHTESWIMLEKRINKCNKKQALRTDYETFINNFRRSLKIYKINEGEMKYNVETSSTFEKTISAIPFIIGIIFKFFRAALFIIHRFLFTPYSMLKCKLCIKLIFKISC